MKGSDLEIVILIIHCIEERSHVWEVITKGRAKESESAMSFLGSFCSFSHVSVFVVVLGVFGAGFTGFPSPALGLSGA